MLRHERTILTGEYIVIFSGDRSKVGIMTCEPEDGSEGTEDPTIKIRITSCFDDMEL